MCIEGGWCPLVGNYGDETLLPLQLELKWDKNRIGMRCDMELGVYIRTQVV